MKPTRLLGDSTTVWREIEASFSTPTDHRRGHYRSFAVLRIRGAVEQSVLRAWLEERLMEIEDRALFGYED